MANQIIVYEASADTRLEVKTDGDTVWLTQDQMSQLFGRERSVITKHIKNIFKEGELSQNSVCANFAHTAEDGKVYEVLFYNLDVIISVGYRVKSLQGTRFRQWATRIIKEMILHRADELRRIEKLENRMDAVETDIKQIKGGMNLLVKQLTAPPPDPPRRRIGFGAQEGDTPTGPYAQM